MKNTNNIKNIFNSLKTRHVKFGGYATLITLVLVAGLLLFNLILGKFSLQFDMTEGGVFSLSEPTYQVIDQIDTPVIFYGIWQPGQENGDVMEVLDLYLARNKNFKYQVLDPDRNPGKMNDYDKEKKGITRSSVIVEGAKGFRVIAPKDMYEIGNFRGQQTVTGIAVEKRLTSALLFVATGDNPVIYEITGHQEFGLEELGLMQFIDEKNYILKQLNLIQYNIPEDASALIIISPRTDLSRPETEKIRDYLEEGGRLLITADYKIQDLSNLNLILEDYGVRFDFGYVRENDPSHTTGEFFIQIPLFLDHEITLPLMRQRDALVVLPFTMGLSFTDEKPRSVNITPFLASSANSWLRSDLYNNSAEMITTDKRGPIAIGMAIKNPNFIEEGDSQARIAAIGTSTVMSTMFGDYSIFDPQFGSNIDLFMNSLSWIQNRPEPLPIRSKNVYVSPMLLNKVQRNIFNILYIIVIPVFFLVMGLVTWLRRRHL